MALENIGKQLPLESHVISFVLYLEIVLLIMFFLAMFDYQKVYPCWAAVLVGVLFGSTMTSVTFDSKLSAKTTEKTLDRNDSGNRQRMKPNNP